MADVSPSRANWTQVSVHAADVKNVLRAYSIEVSASSAHDLKQVRTARTRARYFPADSIRTTSFSACDELEGPTTTATSLTRRTEAGRVGDVPRPKPLGSAVKDSDGVPLGGSTLPWV